MFHFEKRFIISAFDITAVAGSLGWQARELRRLHPDVDRVIIAELEPVVKLGSAMPENIAAHIEHMKGVKTNLNNQRLLCVEVMRTVYGEGLV